MSDPSVFAMILSMGVPIFFAVTLHEVAHAYVAIRLGGIHASDRRRLSLNPLKHLDPVGSVVVPLMTLFTAGVGFGWAKAVPINYENLDRRSILLVASAGVIANLTMATLWYSGHLILRADLSYLQAACSIGIKVNLMLAAFNMIPVPPLDGWHVVTRICKLDINDGWFVALYMAFLIATLYAFFITITMKVF